MDCIKCDNSQLVSIDFCGVSVERCLRCGGMWFDESEISQVKNSINSDTLTDDMPEPTQSVNFKKDLTCIKCSNPLNTINYMGDSGIFVDKCSICGGVWLDSGELEKILQYLKVDPMELAADMQSVMAQLNKAKEDSMEAQKKSKEDLWKSNSVSGKVIRKVFQLFDRF